MAENILRAEAINLPIGDLEFDAIRLLDTKEYRMAKSQSLKPIGLPSNWFSTVCKTGSKPLETLRSKGFTGYAVKVSYTKNGVATRASTLSIQDVSILWRYFDRKGNKKAQDLIDLLSLDSLKDRFEQVFNERRTLEERTQDDRRILDFPCPGEPIFEDWFEEQISRLTGWHKNDIKNGKFYWRFVYYWLTPDERLQLDKINPVLPNGRRKHKIHNCLLPETKERLKPYQLKLAGKMESCNSMAELERMFNRVKGFDQPNLFDGWEV